MKKIIALLMAAVLCVGLVACGGSSEPTQEQQMVADGVKKVINTETFAQWQSLYKEFSGEESGAPEVTNVTHYQIDDFDGEKMDLYLVNVSAGIAYWEDEAAEMGSMEDHVCLLIDPADGTVMDYITGNAADGVADTLSPENRRLYLLWIYGNQQRGDYNGDFNNDTETRTELGKGDLKMINKLLAE